MLETLAVFPGTFDPITLGHIDIIKRASRIFSKVLVAVAQSPSKHTLFTLEERLALVKDACKDYDNISAKAFSGMLVDFLKENHADILVRGIRTVVDYDYEMQLSGMYRALMPEMEIVMLPTENSVAYISSTLVRDVIIHKGEIHKFVPQNVVDYVAKTRN
jgi:pantetheine-phosphate adenylyltransferase